MRKFWSNYIYSWIATFAVTGCGYDEIPREIYLVRPDFDFESRTLAQSEVWNHILGYALLKSVDPEAGASHRSHRPEHYEVTCWDQPSDYDTPRLAAVVKDSEGAPRLIEIVRAHWSAQINCHPSE